MDTGLQILSEAFTADIINLALAITGIAMFSILVLVLLFGVALMRMIGSLRDSNKSLAEQTGALVSVRIEQERVRADHNASSVALLQKMDGVRNELGAVEERRKEWATVEINRGIDETARRLDTMADTISSKFEPIMTGLNGVGDGMKAIETFVKDEFKAIRSGLATTEQNIISKIETMAKGLTREHDNPTVIPAVPVALGDGGNGTRRDTND